MPSGLTVRSNWYNKTGCPIVVVGLRQILHVIRKYEKFEGRIGPHLEFLPPDEDEVLNATCYASKLVP